MIEKLKNQGRVRSMGRVVLKLDHPEINLVLDEKVWLSISWIIRQVVDNQPIPIPKPPRLFKKYLIRIEDTTTTTPPPSNDPLLPLTRTPAYLLLRPGNFYEETPACRTLRWLDRGGLVNCHQHFTTAIAAAVAAAVAAARINGLIITMWKHLSSEKLPPAKKIFYSIA